MFSEPAIDHSEQLRSSNLTIQANNLSKCYRIYDHPRDRLIQAVWGRDRLGRPKQRYREFWALDDVSFELERGKTLGVVGRNGSGKSTLLQLLCGTLQATTGMVKARGRIGALLELGSGFNPEFSGLDNVFLNASLLGLSQAETEQQLEAILSFADIGDFIHQPVKTYSSGMAVRLAFAVQAHTNPDILIVDEALGVGDEYFQKRCYSRINELKSNGTSIILVTHSCPQIVSHCDEALLLHQGKILLEGDPRKVTSTYQRLCQEPNSNWKLAIKGLESNTSNNQNNEQALKPSQSMQVSSSTPLSRVIYPCKGVEIVSIAVADDTSQATSETISFNKDFSILIRIRVDEPLDNVELNCNITTIDGQCISGQTRLISLRPRPRPRPIFIECRLFFRAGLMPGLYFIGAGIHPKDQKQHFLHRVVDSCALRVEESPSNPSFGLCHLSGSSPEIHIPS